MGTIVKYQRQYNQKEAEDYYYLVTQIKESSIKNKVILGETPSLLLGEEYLRCEEDTLIRISFTNNGTDARKEITVEKAGDSTRKISRIEQLLINKGFEEKKNLK